jgi:hypothetical protein
MAPSFWTTFAEASLLANARTVQPFLIRLRIMLRPTYPLPPLIKTIFDVSIGISNLLVSVVFL